MPSFIGSKFSIMYLILLEPYLKVNEYALTEKSLWYQNCNEQLKIGKLNYLLSYVASYSS